MAETVIQCPRCAARYAVPADAARPRFCEKCGAGLPAAAAAEVSPSLPAPAPPTPKTPPGVWQPGQVILDLYEVKQVHKGGTGLVYRVRHRGWDTDLAVKTPRPELVRDEHGK